MDIQLVPVLAVTAFVLLVSIFIRNWSYGFRTTKPTVAAFDSPNASDSISESTSLLIRALQSALPEEVILPHQNKFTTSTKKYWANQECEKTPACIVQPSNAHQLSSAVTIIKHAFDEQEKQRSNLINNDRGIFAVRSGGHSPVAGAAAVVGGILVDMSRFCDVIPSEDGTTVRIGAGTRWMDVSTTLEKRRLAVVGGRNSQVGVGGLILGGKLFIFYQIMLHFLDKLSVIMLTW
jgi:FAD/FMN-containing dehydrogenase